MDHHTSLESLLGFFLLLFADVHLCTACNYVLTVIFLQLDVFNSKASDEWSSFELLWLVHIKTEVG